MWWALCTLFLFGPAITSGQEPQTETVGSEEGANAADQTAEPEKPAFAEGKQRKEGFFDLYWHDESGALYLAIDRFDEPFLFVNSLVTGLGSNDIGLDRGQLGDSRIVSFRRVGKRVYLIQPNLTYRADSDNPLEQRAVAESFAYSTLWGGDIAAEENGTAFVDVSDFVFRDEHGVAQRLQRMDEGRYQLDKSRSHHVPDRVKAFPDNVEIETALTFTGQPTGRHTPTVAPTPQSFTLRQRYSLVRLPDAGYQPRRFHPKSGAFSMTYRDYAAPLNQPVEQKLVWRHRLELRDPDAALSDAVEPIVYYVDSGAPAEIQQALVEGASWWTQAFEAAGIRNGFRVEIMPPDMDPMDVRYNVIQWVHRSTRGWSYGGSVRDPRTGEIIKGHVTLGSLRVRQDRLLFEGMIPRNQDGTYPPGKEPVQLALARIRQLSAHEVGHTLGLTHNFAASVNDRASVMDYPAPLVRLRDGELDFSAVYDTGIGAWDKLAIRYLYAHFADEEAGLKAVLNEAAAKGLLMVGDRDGRPPHAMHPFTHVWDNGGDAIAEFARVLVLRQHLLSRFGPANAPRTIPLANLEDWLTPVYLHHRFQLAACAKSVGGAFYDYGFNDGDARFERVSAEQQRQALDLMLSTLDPNFLDLPPHLRNLIPPRALGYGSDREAFQTRAWPAFDEMSLPETAAQMTISILLAPQRVNRLYNQHADDAEQMGVEELVARLLGATTLAEPPEGERARAIHRQAGYLAVSGLLSLAADKNLRDDARAQTWAALHDLRERLGELEAPDAAYAAQFRWIDGLIETAEDEDLLFTPTEPLRVPPGSPIGQTGFDCAGGLR